jgi:hypothetical protein
MGRFRKLIALGQSASFRFFLKIRKSTIELSIKKFFQCKNEMKLGFGGRIWKTRELEVRRG